MTAITVGDHYMKCKSCGTTMTGMRDYEKRKKCESCGGNKTKYNEKNINPDSRLARRKK